MKTIKSVCPLDCWDQCALLIESDKGKLVSVGPDSDQPVTGNLICSKGRQHLERFNHPERLRYPLLKKGDSFGRVSWEEALQTMAAKISESLNRYGPLSLLHFYDGGYGGVLKNIESRFFSALGGNTTHNGSLCWGAGLAAQKYDFGASVGHPYEDLLNSRFIIIWGRNPSYTSIHLLPYIREARKNGAKVVLIDPVKTATAAECDQYIRVKPGSDGALAMAMGRIMVEKDLIDHGFIDTSSSGFEEYKNYLLDFDLEKAAGLTGLTVKQIEELALEYAAADPASISIGIGLQRHSNGGNTVRAIDALAAIAGNVGKRGGGASYANFVIDRYIDHGFLRGDDLKPKHRYYSKPMLAKALSDFRDPPVDFLYISRANPAVQVGDSDHLRIALDRVSFIVTAEHFMTDTALLSDLVLPCTSFLEDDDIFYNSMSHQYIGYAFSAAKPPGECRNEYGYLKELAGLLGCEGFPDMDPHELLAKIIKPLTDATGITLEDIKRKSPLMLPGGDQVPWIDRVFETPDGKYNFYSEAAKEEYGDGIPHYHKPKELSDRSLHEKGFCYWFLTPHPRDSIHSTNRLPDNESIPKAYINSQTAEKEELAGGETVMVTSPRGSIKAVLKISEDISPDTVMVYQGWWHITGAAVNLLTADRLTDLGSQAAYYDCLCRIDKAE